LQLQLIIVSLLNVKHHKKEKKNNILYLKNQKSFYFNGFGCCVPSWIVIIEVKGCSATGI
jgi:hypothetical protein